MFQFISSFFYHLGETSVITYIYSILTPAMYDVVLAGTVLSLLVSSKQLRHELWRLISCLRIQPADVTRRALKQPTSQVVKSRNTYTHNNVVMHSF